MHVGGLRVQAGVASASATEPPSLANVNYDQEEKAQSLQPLISLQHVKYLIPQI